jgi:hypothetical protein
MRLEVLMVAGLKMEAVCFFKTLVSTNKYTQHHNPENQHFWGDQIKDEIGRICSMHGGDTKCIQNFGCKF